MKLNVDQNYSNSTCLLHDHPSSTLLYEILKNYCIVLICLFVLFYVSVCLISESGSCCPSQAWNTLHTKLRLACIFGNPLAFQPSKMLRLQVCTTPVNTDLKKKKKMLQNKSFFLEAYSKNSSSIAYIFQCKLVLMI